MKTHHQTFPTGTRILLVEDTVVTRKILHQMLYQLGYMNVIPVSDGREAWDELLRDTSHTIGLVISDWKMPSLSGLELLRRVRSHPEMKELPFVLLTSLGSKEAVVQAIESGVTNYLVKPFQAESLQENLKGTWERAVGKKSA